MAAIKSKLPARDAKVVCEPTRGSTLPHEPVAGGTIAFVELLFFAYRDFTGEPDAMLEEYGLGRAHHRALHFVNRQPGMRVADLLAILKITKQSLARVLKQLIDAGWIEARAGAEDRRERLLYTTPHGGTLARSLADRQMERIAAALAATGAGGEDHVRRFLFAMIAADERGLVADRLSRAFSCDEGTGSP